MNLSFGDEQTMFAESVSRFLDSSCDFERRRQCVAERRWGDASLWQGLAELGCFGVAIPEAAGGFGGDAAGIGLLARALGRYLVIEPVIGAMVAGTLLAGVAGVTDEIEALIAGTQRFAVLDGMVVDDGAVSGEAHSVVGATSADAFLVPQENALYLVDAADVRIAPIQLLHDGMAGDITASGVAARPLAAGPEWDNTRARAAVIERIALVWQALGTMEAATDATAAYMRDRSQFGHPLGDLQSVQHRVAEMVVAVKEAEAAALLAALAVDSGDPRFAVRALATAQFRTASAAEIVANTAVQLHGGMGVSDELDIAARFRSLQAFRVRVALDAPVSTYADSVVAERGHYDSAVLLGL